MNTAGPEPSRFPGAFSLPGAMRALEAALVTAAPETSGTTIGPYKLLQKLGEGGFGVVWMAEQQSPIRRRVALKIIKTGMDTEEVIARFEAERQALALMDHPNIARVFDAGATSTGRPYFVMELVRGVAITRYCDQNRLPPVERLRLFVSVCRAVQHAHQKGVIHRDLKPSNILVTLHDGAPVPKIIDFGIAKATDKQLTEKTLFTQFHAFIGTPAYTSPEQMEMSGLDVDTRSDIYSLGVLLYELLAGRPPFDPDALAKSGLDAMRRTLREVDPPRPSTRLDTLPENERSTVAHQRDTDAARLSVLLRGDLDWVVMHCLEKDRTRRYETANALARDVERHLAGEPVTARPPSRVYQVQKFVRRHRVGVVAGTALAFSLVAGLIASSLLLVRERRAHARATESERAEAGLRREAEAARAAETIRASRTARDLADQLLAQGRASEGLAYLVHAARKNPADSTLAPYLASALASRTFLVPEGPPLKFPARIAQVRYLDSGRKIAVYCDDGTLGVIDTASGGQVRLKLPAKLATGGAVFTGRVIVVQGDDGIVRILNPETGQLQREFDFGRKINRISVRNAAEPVIIAVLDDASVVVAETMSGRVRTTPFTLTFPAITRLSPDGRWLVRADTQGNEPQLCDLLTGKSRALRVAGNLKAVQFSPDGTRLAVTATNGSSEFVLQLQSVPDAVDVAPLQFLRQHNHSQSFVVTFSPDGRLFSVAAQHGQQLFSTGTGERVGPFLETGFLSRTRRSEAEREWREIDHPALSFRGALFAGSGENRRIITAGDLNTRRDVNVREAATGQIVLSAPNHGSGVNNALLSEEVNALLSVTGDGFLMLWDVNTGALRAEPGMQQPSTDFDFALSPRGDEIAIGRADGVVQRVRVSRGAARGLTLPRSLPPMPAPFFADTTPRLLWLTSERAVALNVASGAIETDSAFPDRIRGLVAGGRGGIGIRADLRYMVVQPLAGGWEAWAIAGARVERRVPLVDAPAGDGWVCFSPQGDHVAMIPRDQPRTVRFWELATGRPAGKTLTHVSAIYTANAVPASFSPDGRRFAAGTVDGTVRVWDVATGGVLLEWPDRRDSWVTFVQFNASGTRIATRNSSGEAQLWDAATGRRAGDSATFGVSAALMFSPSGERLLTWGGSIARIWDAETGAAMGEPMEHPGVAIRGASWSADSRRIVTGAQDSTARIWDARTGRPVSEPLPHDARVVSCDFSPDGRFVRTEHAGRLGVFTAFVVWAVPPDAGDAPAPEWLLQLATSCAGKRIDASGKCVDAPEAPARLDELRRQLAALPANAPFAEWGRWILDDRPDRPIAPGFALTTAEADRLATRLAGPAPAAPP